MLSICKRVYLGNQSKLIVYSCCETMKPFSDMQRTSLHDQWNTAHQILRDSKSTVTAPYRETAFQTLPGLDFTEKTLLLQWNEPFHIYIHIHTYIHTYIHTCTASEASEAPKSRYPAWTKKCVQTLVSAIVLKHSGEPVRNLIFWASGGLSKHGPPSVCMYACMLSMYVCMLSMYVCMLSMYVCWACMYVCWACIVQGRRRQVQNPSACEGFCDSNST